VSAEGRQHDPLEGAARVEHVFGDQKNGMGAELVRTIGIVRARCKIGMTNLVYNMRRFVCLERMTAAAG
jgi:transposase, IS5 family